MTESDITSLETRIAELEQARRDEIAAQRRVSRATLAVSASILLIILCFGLVIYAHANYEWTEDKLTASLQQELDELNPVAMEQARALGAYLLPIYAEEGRKQLKQMGPEISRRLGRQTSMLSSELRADLHAKMQVSQKSIRKQTSEVLFAAYPSLQDPAEQQRLADSFRGITEDAVKEAVTGFDQRFSKDVKDLERLILDFNDSESKESTLDLQKKFIHLWLQLVDTEIMKL